MSGTGPSKGAVLTLMLLAAVAILAVAAFSIASKNKEAGNRTTVSPRPTPTSAPQRERADSSFTGIVEAVNTSAGTLQFWDVETQQVLLLDYDSSTEIRDKYGLHIVAGQLTVGDIVNVGYDSETRKTVTVGISNETWELVRQTGISAGKNRALITNGTRNFAYSESLHVLDGDRPMELEEILKSDIVTLRGIGDEIYVILLLRGHGYLTLKEDDDYIGGSLTAGYEYLSQITKDMVLTLNEGTYRLTLENEELTATVDAVIRRGQTTELDLTAYARVPDPSGQVTFHILPEGSLLWLNDEKIWYAEPVTLKYGGYRIRVESGGYVSYEGTIEVNSAALTFSVTLPENPKDDPKKPDGNGDSTVPGSGDDSGGDGSGTGGSEENASGTGTGSGGENAGGSGTGSGGENASGSGTDSGTGGSNGNSLDNTSEQPGDGSYQVDENHYIIIYSDDEVEVYLDDDYMGVTEDGQAVMEKFIGSFTLKLVKGDETKSYLIQVDDDGEDFVFRRYFE
ncbi:MAG: hypothetical protein K2N94_04305 [Lachnospiraceae bacterium]|nr:hypothetical protein [Lachnospiraceae bacterium]